MSMPTNNTVSYTDLPALYLASDNASISAQKQFVKLTAAYIFLMIMATIAGSIALSSPSIRTVLAMTSAIFLTLSAFLRIAIRATKVEKTWYNGRSVAESVKTLSWRYMMATEPFHTTLGQKADNLFISELSEILNQQKSFAANLAGKANSDHQITDRMRMVRSQVTEERKRIYITDRIGDQMQWYNKKADVNTRLVDKFFAGMVASQVLGVIFAFCIVIWPAIAIHATGIFTTVATSLLAWTQMRQNEQLAQSYGLASQELSLILEKAVQVKTDEELITYVINSENAISREHTMWVARRN